MPSKVKIWWDNSVDAYRIVTPYNPQFVDLIKQLVPISDRAYDPESKTWTVTERFMEPMKQVCKTVWKEEPTVVSKANSQQASASGANANASGVAKGDSLDIALANFVRLLPYDAAQKAYRLAALELHPDRGGSMDKMSALNAVWTKIQEEFFKRT